MTTLNTFFRSLLFLSQFVIFSAKIYAGDTPCTATVLPSNDPSFTAFTINASGSSGGVAAPFCGNYINGGGECWLQFTAPVSGFVTLQTLVGTAGNIALAIYKTPCNNPTLVSCYENTDCGGDSMPNVTLQSLTANAIYLIRVWREGGGGGTFRIRLNDPRQPFSTLGTAVNNSPTPGCTRITLPVVSQRGCAWHPREIDFSYNFEKSLDMYFGTRNANGADGMAIVFQPNGLNICGSQGGSLGAQGIPKSIIIELDTWDNNTPYEIPQDHLAVTINGITNSNASPPLGGPAALPNIEDGNLHKVRINWTAATKLFQVRVDGILYMDFFYDFVALVFGGDPTVNWGVTGSTGASYNSQYFCYSDSILSNTSSYTLHLDTVICEGQSLFAGGSWQTQAGIYNDLLKKTSSNCDSTLITKIVVNPKTFATIDTTICAGTTVSFGGKSYSTDTTDTILLRNARSCDSTLIVKVKVINIAVSIAKPDTITCLKPNLTLQAFDNTLQNTNNSYSWTTSGGGNIVSGAATLSPKIDGGGIYQLNITYNDGIHVCSNIPYSVTVKENVTKPNAIIIFSDTITCKKPTVLLKASVFENPSDAAYQWTTNNGNIVAGNNSTALTVDSGGLYRLTVLNVQNGCRDSASATVVKNITPPIAQITSLPQAITCLRKSVVLDASGSNFGANYTVVWNTQNGTVASGGTTLMPSVTQNGVYTVVITNSKNGCTANASTVVSIDTLRPVVAVANPPLINCVTKSVNLVSSQIGANSPKYNWTTIGGNIVGSNINANVVADKIGIYFLTVTNPANGCDNSATIEVKQDIQKPIAEAGNIVELNCKKLTANLLPQGSSVGSIYRYFWTSNDGTIISGDSTLSPKIGKAGEYKLRVLNTENGCENFDSVQVLNIIPEKMLLDIQQPRCAGDKGSIEILSVTGGKLPYSYQFGVLNPVSIDPFFTNLFSGNYQIIAQDANGCQLTQTVNIDSALQIRTQLTRDWSINLGESVVVDLSVNLPNSKIASIVWKPAIDSSNTDLLHPILMPTVTTDYLLILTDTNGCKVSDRLRIVVDKRPKIFIPNIIYTESTRNENKILYIFAKENSVKKIVRFQVFDRWGELVFAANNFPPNDAAFGWDGSFKGKITSGVYVYFAEVTFIDEKTEIFSGDVTVIK